MIGGVVEEGTREGEVSGSNPTDRVAHDFTRKNARLATETVVLKSFFFLFLKTDFIFFTKRFLQSVGITEPPVEMFFHRQFSVTRLWKNLFPHATKHRRFAKLPVKRGCTSELV